MRWAWPTTCASRAARAPGSCSATTRAARRSNWTSTRPRPPDGDAARSVAREARQFGSVDADLGAGGDDFAPGHRVDLNARGEALRLAHALRLAGHEDPLDTGGRRRRRVPADERLDLGGEVLGAAEPSRIDQDRQHAIEHLTPAVANRADRRAAGERAAEQLADQCEARSLVLAEGQQGAVRLDHRVARVGGRIAVVVDDRAGLERHALVVGDAGLALRDPAGRE